jgi:hypothetical protein
VDAWPSTHIGHELIAAGMMILTGGGRGLPLDYDELERWTRVGIRAGYEMTQGERFSLLLTRVRKPASTAPTRWNNGCSCTVCRRAHSDAERARGRTIAQERFPVEMRRQFLDALCSGQPFSATVRDLGLTSNQAWGLTTRCREWQRQRMARNRVLPFIGACGGHIKRLPANISFSLLRAVPVEIRVVHPGT